MIEKMGQTLAKVCNSRGGELTSRTYTAQEQLASAISEKIHPRGGQVILTITYAANWNTGCQKGILLVKSVSVK